MEVVTPLPMDTGVPTGGIRHAFAESVRGLLLLRGVYACSDVGADTWVPMKVNADGAMSVQIAGVGWTSAWGIASAPVVSADMSVAPVAVTDAPVAGQRLVIDDIIVSSDTPLRFTFTEETGAVLAYVRVLANLTLFVPFNQRKFAAANQRVMCQTSGAGNVEVLVAYHSET